MDDAELKKRHRKTITLSTVVSILAICGVVLPVFGALAAPWVVDFMSEAMADETAAEVRKQVAPMSAGLKVLIEDTIAELEDDISALEFRRDNQALGASWTAADAQVLTNKRRRLESQRQALRAILAAERDRDEDP